MAEIAKYVQQAFRFVAVAGGVVALLGVAGIAAFALVAAEQSGMSVPISLGLTNDEAEQLVVSGGVALVAGVVLNIFANTVASFAAGFRSSPEPAGSGLSGSSGDVGDGAGSSADGGPAGTGGEPSVPADERFRRKLQRTYLFLVAFVGFLVVLTLAGETATAATVGSGVADVVFAIAAVALKIFFGSVTGALGVLVVLGALWFGVRQAASEALVAGFVVALLFLPGAILTGSVGLVLFALTLLYYNFFARGATEFRWLTPDSVPATVRDFVS